MSEVKLHGKEKLLEDLKMVGNTLPKSISVYLIGGCAMALRDIKSATKDVDAIFLSLEDLRLFEDQLLKLGYGKTVEVEEEYQKLGTYSILRNPEKAGFDLFHMKVCDMLVLSSSMVERSVRYGDFGKLMLFLLSNEDIVLFKGLTERPRDIDDIAAIIKKSLETGENFDWDHIKKECKTQTEHLKMEGHLYNRFQELLEKYEIRTPLLPWLKKKDINHLLEEVYNLRREKGISHKEIIEQFKKDGFNKVEIAKLETFKKTSDQPN